MKRISDNAKERRIWLGLGICLFGLMLVALAYFDATSPVQASNAKTFECAHCSDTRYHVHQGIDKRHYEDY